MEPHCMLPTANKKQLIQRMFNLIQPLVFFSFMVSAQLVYAQDTLKQELIKFSKSKIQVGAVKIIVEMAVQPKEQARGLMFRKSLCENCGMLFVYQDEQIRSFWMKNTFIPLSIGFFNKKKELIDVQEMTPVQSEMQLKIPTYESKGRAMFALEMNAGWFRKNKIGMKTKFRQLLD